MSSETYPQTYQSEWEFNPNNPKYVRKKAYLDLTFKHVGVCRLAFFSLKLAVSGGATPKIFQHAMKVRDVECDLPLALATTVFRPLQKRAVPDASAIVPDDQVADLFAAAAKGWGIDTNPLTNQYFSSAKSEDVYWVDTRKLYNKLVKLAPFGEKDVNTFYQEGWMPIPGHTPADASKGVSAIFGTDPKECRFIKAAIATAILEIMAEANPTNHGEIKRVIYRAMNMVANKFPDPKIAMPIANPKQARKFYKKDGSGPDSFFMKMLDEEDDTKSINLKTLVASLNSIVREKSFEIEFTDLEAMRQYLLAQFRNVPKDIEIYEQAWNNADVYASASRNYSLAVEKLELSQKIQNNTTAEADLKLLSPFNPVESDFNSFKWLKDNFDKWATGKLTLETTLSRIKKRSVNKDLIRHLYNIRHQITADRVRTAIEYCEAAKGRSVLDGYFKSAEVDYFVIEPQHLGDSRLQDLFKKWEKHNHDLETTISEFVADLESELKKHPVAALLRYVHSVRSQTTADQLLIGAKTNEILDKLARQKVAPLTLQRLSCNWGDNGFSGQIIRREEAAKGGHLKDRPESPDLKIWFNLSLYTEEGRKKHHYSIVNARMMREIYFPGTVASQAAFRTPRFDRDGDYFDTPLKAEQVAYLQTVSPRYRGQVARCMKIVNAAEQGKLPKVEYDDKNVTIAIDQKDNGRYLFRVVYKSPIQRPPKSANIGDCVVSMDGNQTVSHTYALTQFEKDSSNGAIRDMNGRFQNVLETGPLTFQTAGPNKKCYDQLSYNGLEYPQYKQWRDEAMKFLAAHPTYKRSDGKTVNVLEDFKRMEVWQPPLYMFNKLYAAALQNLMRGKRGQELAEFKTEILRFLSDHKGSMSIRRLASLSPVACDALKKAIGLVYAYFCALIEVKLDENRKPLPGQRTEQDKEREDAVMYAVQQSLIAKRRNRNQAKPDQTANSAMKIVLDNNARFFKYEFDLPAMGKKSVSKKQNSRNTDWLIRGVSRRLKDMGKFHGVKMVEVLPHSTSHQDPGVHSSEQSAYKARHKKILVAAIHSELTRYDVIALARSVKHFDNDMLKGVAKYYRDAAVDFLKHYGLERFAKTLSELNTNKEADVDQLVEQLKQALAESGQTEIYLPKKGGRIYLATKKVTAGAYKVNYNGVDVWVSDSDELAAVNISLAKDFIDNN